MSWIKKAITRVENVCKTVDATVGGVLLKTEQKITGGFTFDEEAEFAVDAATPKVKAVCDTALPTIKKGAVCTGAAVKKAACATASGVKKTSSTVVEKATPVVHTSIDGMKKASTVVVGTVKKAVSKVRSLKVKPVVVVDKNGEVKEALHVEGSVQRRTV